MKVSLIKSLVNGKIKTWKGWFLVVVTEKVTQLQAIL